MHCPICNQDHPEGSVFCPMTGKKIFTQGICPHCLKPVEPNWLHCNYCGQNLTNAEVNANSTEISKPKAQSSILRWGMIAGGICGLIIIVAIVFNTFWNGLSAEQSATLTATAWTSTPTVIPTNTLTPTLLVTLTPIPTITITPTFTITPPTLLEGWRGYDGSGFYIALPKDWDVGIQNEKIKFSAQDSKSAGVGYASVNVNFESNPYSSLDEVCELMPAVYKEIGFEVLDTKCGLEINKMPVVQFMGRIKAGDINVKQMMYIFGQEQNIWILVFTVNEPQWAKYQPVFDTIAESFSVSE